MTVRYPCSVHAAGRGCPAGTVELTWTKKAGKGTHRTITKATVLVNGAKVKTVKKPRKNQVTHVTGINPAADARVQVVLKVTGKGQFYTDRSAHRVPLSLVRVPVPP